MPTTRLSAIMFTDIVGYTAMMQSDRSTAMAAVKQHEAILRDRITQHGGELLQTYGDGSLSIFNSASAAVQCAREIQEQVRESVPLRIGLHIGEITRDGDHTFGDGVNIASRIESMGIAGAVLVSSNIRQHVKNKPEFELESLGKFSFKNVAEPMTVYALANEGFAVPKPEEMKGKGAKTQSTSHPARKLIRLGGLGFLAMMIGGLLFWALGAGNAAGELPASIKAERVAVIPFRNNTGKETLDAYGALCSDVITNGLTEAGIKTSSPQTIQQYQHLIGVLPNNPEGKPAFAEVLNARYWIEGYFLQKGDSLFAKSQLIDGMTGEAIRNFPAVSEHIDHKEQLANQLTRRIMGYWVAKEVIDRGKFKPPVYEAFIEYQKIFHRSQGYWPDPDRIVEHAQKAYAIDSTFYLATLREMFWQADRKKKETDTLIAQLQPHYEKMTPFEQGLFNANIALYNRDWLTYSRIREKQYQLFPQDLSTSHYQFHLATRENRPQKAWEVGMTTNWANLVEEMSQWRAYRMGFICMYGLSAEKHEEVMEFCNRYLKNQEDPGLYFMYKCMASIRSGQVDTAFQLAADIQQVPVASHWSHPEFGYISFCNLAARELLLQEKQEQAQQFLQMAEDWALEVPERIADWRDSLDLAETYRLKGQHKQALELELPSLIHIEELPPWEHYKAHFIVGTAEDLIQTGQRDQAEALMAKVSGYHQARIYALLGNKEEAMKPLLSNKKGGWATYFPFYLQHDYYMRNMFGYPPFEEFTRVRD